MTRPPQEEIRLPLWTRVLLGACAGTVLPVLVLVRVEVFNPRATLLAVSLGPAFGAFFVYYLDRYGPGSTTQGRISPHALAGGLAGGAATALAYDFGVLTAAWNVAVGIIVGAALGVWIGWERSPQGIAHPDNGPRRLSTQSHLSRVFAWKLADEVLDAGQHLVIKRGREELIVPWHEIAAVEESQRFGELITIHFGRRGPMGGSVTFCPPFRLSGLLYAPSPIAAHLRARMAGAFNPPTVEASQETDELM
jgi:hypothetical protein